MKKFLISLLSVLLLCSLLTGCSGTAIQSASGGDIDAVSIVLNGESAKAKGRGVKVSGPTVTISAPGSYKLSGELKDGQIIVDTGDDAGLVTLILDGASVSNSNTAAIHVVNGKDMTLKLAKGTENTVRSGSEADMDAFDNSAEGAAIYAQDDLDIEGEGSLTVLGYLNNGIGCKNDLDIKGGNIAVTAVNNGIRGSDSVEIKGGVITVKAGNDGIKATEADKADKGFVSVSGGKVTLNCGGDGMSAEKELTVSGGKIEIHCGTADSLNSGKGLKAKTGLTVSGGDIAVYSVDHCIHSTVGLDISGGNMTLLSDDGKGISAHDKITVTGGNLAVSSAKAGIDSESDISISGGKLRVTSGKDALNYKGLMTISGGELIGLGFSKRVKSFDDASTQGFFASSFTGSAGSTLTVKSGGNLLWSAKAGYGYNTVICSSSRIVTGETYTLANGSTSLDITA